MRDFIKRVAIGVAVGLSLFFIKSKCFALSLDQSFISNVQFFSTTTQKAITISDSTTGTATSTQVNFLNTVTAPAGSEFLAFTTSFALENDVTNQGNNSIQNFEFVMISSLIINFQIVSQESGYSSFCEVSSNYVICPVTAGIHYTSIRIQTVHIQSATLSTLYINLSSYNSFYKRYGNNSAVVSATEQQTQDLLDSDSPASSTYDNDYSSDDYDDAQESINSQLDVDVSTLLFDPTQWAQSFSYIWSLVTSFLQINSKVFATVTGFLTLSFVGLVIGRS